MSATILVTGANGAAGKFVVPALLAKGFRVRGQFARAPGSRSDVDWRRADFMESLDFTSLVEGCDAVVHLAAELWDAPRMDRVNVDATRALVAAAQAGGVRYFGHASSIVVYGSPRRRDVDETTPLLDPRATMVRQYHAEPYMLDYARTKTLGELAIRELDPAICIDLYRPAVVADLDRLLEAGDWSAARRVGAAYRRAQYVHAPYAAAAIGHLTERGLSCADPRQKVEAYNICDETCGTFREILARARAVTGDRRYRTPPEIPVLLDLAKDLAKYRNPVLRYPLGMLRLSSAKLRATGFAFPTGFPAALELAIEARRKSGGSQDAAAH